MTLGAPSELRRCAALHPDVEAVLERCGRETFDVVLIDSSGAWTRWVLASAEEAEALVQQLGVPVHHGREEAPRMARRLNRDDPWSDPRGTRRAVHALSNIAGHARNVG